jgi:hypothetical protein
MLPDTLDEIRVAGATGRPRQRPDRLLADKGYSSRANRAWLPERGIATTIPERDDQIAHRASDLAARSTSVTSTITRRRRRRRAGGPSRHERQPVRCYQIAVSR